jgi:hypothetical protein
VPDFLIVNYDYTYEKTLQAAPGQDDTGGIADRGDPGPCVHASVITQGAQSLGHGRCTRDSDPRREARNAFAVRDNPTKQEDGGPCWARTSDLDIKSILLYRLS